MTIESILRRKGTNVTTIAPEASIKTGGRLAPRKEYRRSRGDK